jgi:hypothetical protein
MMDIFGRKKIRSLEDQLRDTEQGRKDAKEGLGYWKAEALDGRRRIDLAEKELRAIERREREAAWQAQRPVEINKIDKGFRKRYCNYPTQERHCRARNCVSWATEDTAGSRLGGRAIGVHCSKKHFEPHVIGYEWVDGKWKCS